METGEVFESGLDSNSSFVQVIEDEEDVGANVVLSTASPPPARSKPMKLIKVITSRVQHQNVTKASQNKVSTKIIEPCNSVFVEKVIEGFNVESIKEEITPEDLIEEEFGVTEATQDRENEMIELTAELCQPSMKEIVQYELLYPGGPIEQMKVEQVTEEHDYVPVPDPVKEYFCGVCGKSYSSEKSVRQHMTRTHGAPPETAKKRYQPVKKAQCELCGRKYASPAALRYHQRVHTGERPFQCTECPKAFTMPLFLQIHMRTHTGERPYACATCPKAFANQAALLRHNRVHTGIKPYKCEECGKSFTQSNSKKLHIRTVHLKLPAPYMSRERRLRQLRRNGLLPPNLPEPKIEPPTDPGAESDPLRPRKVSYVIEPTSGVGGSYVVAYDRSDED